MTPAVLIEKTRPSTRKEREFSDEITAVIDRGIERLSPQKAVKILTATVEAVLARHTEFGSGTAAALTRGIRKREELKQAEGGSLSAEKTAEMLGMSKEAVLKRFRKHQLVGWREPKQDAVRIAVWQFQDGELLPGMKETLQVLAESRFLDAWGRMLFFLTPRTSLKNQTPLDLLRAGKIEPVLRAAHGVAE